MEWTWREQGMLLVQCGGFGMALGVLYDSVTVWQRFRHHSHRRVFGADCAFCLFAALMTFFFALATMDGRMHPLLFVGGATGMLVERCGIGRVYRRALYRLLSLVRLIWRRVKRVMRCVAGCLLRLAHNACLKIKKLLKNVKKYEKSLAICLLKY